MTGVLWLYVLYMVMAPCVTQPMCRPCVCKWNAKRELVANCASKHLTEIPKAVPTYVSSLILKRNHFTQLKDNSLKEFTVLKHLDLSRNKLSSLSLNSFIGARSLLSLDLSRNMLVLNEVTYPLGMFRDQKQLLTLNLRGNLDYRNAIYPDKVLSDLTSLQTLSIDGIHSLKFNTGFLNLTKLTHISISGYKGGNCRSHFIKNDSFLGIKYVRHLNISNCEIYHIEKQAFEPFARTIETLDLSDNRQLGLDNFGDAMYGLRNSSIQCIFANALVTTYAIGVVLKLKHIEHLANTGLKHIHLDSNRLETFDDLAPALFSNLETISMNLNRPTFGTYLLSLDIMTNLKRVDSTHQYTTNKLPLDFKMSHVSDKDIMISKVRLQPAKKNTRINDYTHQTEEGFIKYPTVPHSFNSWYIVPIPPEVTYLNVSYSRLEYNVQQLALSNNKLTTIDASSNMFRKWIGPISPLDSLTFLDLSNNYCTFIKSDFFNSSHQLRILNISHNDLAEVLSNDKESKIFGNLQRLEILVLGYNTISYLPPFMFKTNTKLQILDLSGNSLETWQLEIRHMRKLHLLDISNNRFESIPENLRKQISEILKGRKESFSLRVKGNYLKCTCKMLESLEWMLQVTVEDGNYTSCQLDNGHYTTLGDLKGIVKQLSKDCRTLYPLIIGTCLALTGFFLIVAAGIIYRYRWKLRYMYFTTRRRYRGYQRVAQEEQFAYDAFVSYAEEDRYFVMGDMLDQLETTHGLRLCIHDRDFMVGEAITANIVNAIQSSRKTVVVLTPNFLKSEWCNYEVRMARMESIHTERDLLCVLWLKDIPNMNHFSCDLITEINRASYSRFPNDVGCHQNFWATFKEGLVQ